MESNENGKDESIEVSDDTLEKKACLVDEVEYKFCLPVLTDGKTESYVKVSKILLIVQAIDNRHKSLVKKLKEKYKQICAVWPEANTSSRSLMYGSFRDCSEEDKRQLMRENVRQKCQNGFHLVIVNSVLNLEDMRQLYDLSRELGYVILFEPWKLDRNTVQMPRERAMSSLLNGSLINNVFFAWFLNERDSLALRQECVMYMKDCVGKIKEFENMLEKCGALSDPPGYFQFGVKALEQDLLYCAFKFCGNSYVASDKEMSLLTTKGVYGQVTKLKVFGFIVSPFAIGAKVKLTHKQKELVDRHSKVDMCTYGERRSTFTKRAQDKYSSGRNQTCFSKCESTLETFIDKQYDAERPYASRGQISIMTLGYVKSKMPRDAAHELSDAVSRELNAMTNDTDVESWSIGRSSVYRYGKYWLINLHDMLSVDAILSSEMLVK